MNNINEEKYEKDGYELIGYVGVDSGQLMVCDPCYIDSEWTNSDTNLKDHSIGEFNYDGVCETSYPNGSGQLNYKAGHSGVGVCFFSGYGDGMYPVFAKKENGRVIEVKIIMG